MPKIAAEANLYAELNLPHSHLQVVDVSLVEATSQIIQKKTIHRSH